MITLKRQITVLILLVVLLSGICFSEANKKELFTNSLKQAELYYTRGDYRKTIEILQPLNLDQVAETDGIGIGDLYKALTLLGDSYIKTNRFLEGMSAFGTISGMSDDSEPYPIYLQEIIDLLNDRITEAKDLSGQLSFKKDNIPDYYLVEEYLLALSEKRYNIRLNNLQKISDNSRYRTYSSEFGKQLMNYFDGKIKYQQLFESTVPRIEFSDEIYAVKLLVALKFEKIDNSLNEARGLYFDIYNNSVGFYHWFAGKQLGLSYLLNFPLIIKDGKVQQRERNLKFEASSSLYDEPQKYPIANIFDNNLNTAWVKGKLGDGIGEWINVGFEPESTLSQIKIINGYAKSKEIYMANNRVKKVMLIFSDGKSQEFVLKDNILDYQTIKLTKPIKTDSVRITIEEIYKGTKYNDTCISEIKFQ